MTVMSGNRWVQRLEGGDRDWAIWEGDKRNPSSVEDSYQSTAILLLSSSILQRSVHLWYLSLLLVRTPLMNSPSSNMSSNAFHFACPGSVRADLGGHLKYS